MLVLGMPWLILLISTIAISFGDFRHEGIGEDKMKSHEPNGLENSLPYLRTNSENGRLSAKPRRSRRGTGDGAQIPGNFCPGCSSSYTPYFSGQCFLCPPGVPGPRGPPGQQGVPGRDGRDGRDAVNERGDVGMMDNSDLQEDSTLKGNKTGGAVYVRWGRYECPSQSQLIYEGIAGGSYYSQKGGGSNILCMPGEPIYDEPIAGSSGQARGYLYAAEYQTSSFATWNHLHNSNVYCAVCWAANRPSLMMVPARNVCPGPEWTKEYTGYLVSEYYNHASRTEYVCMDRNPDAVPRSSYNTDGPLFYVVEGRCGSHGSGLPCGPYVDGYELTCAVCTR